ncbi:hypothetical protein, partial [Escherichia coli]|uniref:hypothetical protein n=1 Tax=Escherichia coli TaxID=562 RepID=UPI0014133C95
LQGDAVTLLSLIDEAAERTKAGSDDSAPVVDRNLVTVSAASEQLEELFALNGVMAIAEAESRAA